MVVFTLASDVTATSRILNIHSLSSSWLFAAMSSNGPIRMEVLETREKTCGLLPFPSGRTTRKNDRTKYIDQSPLFSYSSVALPQLQMSCFNNKDKKVILKEILKIQMYFEIFEMSSKLPLDGTIIKQHWHEKCTKEATIHYKWLLNISQCWHGLDKMMLICYLKHKLKEHEIKNNKSQRKLLLCPVAITSPGLR